MSVQHSTQKKQLIKTDPHPLKTVFKEAGITQLELEQYTGISQSQISIFLSGRRTIPDSIEELLQRAANALERA